MNKQYLMLNLESDTFKGMKADFDELPAAASGEALCWPYR